jgi:hypothetical protein
VLLALAEAAANEVATFRIRLSSGLAAVQDSVRDLEASARVVRNFQPGIIPGLPQTAEYARQIMALAGIGHHGSHAAAVAARLRRQQALHNPDRSFEFLLTEAALRYRPAPPQAPTAQPGGRRHASTNQTLAAGPGARSLPGYHRQVPLPGHPIETARLTLRYFTSGDFDDLYAY